MEKLLKPAGKTGLLFSLLLAGAIATGWLSQRADRQMREKLLRQTQLLAEAVNIESVKALTGTEADLESPAYLRLKEQLAAVRAANPKYRFIYLMGQKADETVFFFVDESPQGHPEEAPEGMIYDDVPEGFRRVFSTRTGTVEGPFTDQWGSFVSGCIPLIDHESGKVLAALAIDFDAARWKQAVAAQSFLPAGLTVLGLAALVLAGSSLLSRRSRNKGVHPWWQRHLEPILTLACGLMLTLFAAWVVQHERQWNRFIAFQQLAESQTAALANTFRSLQEVELEGLARFFEGSESVTADEFRKYAQYLTKNHAVQAWGWMPAVPASGKEQFEKTVRAAGVENFQIWERDAEGNSVAAKGREVYYPVLHSLPDNKDWNVIGYDIGSESIRYTAIDEALRTGISTSTDPVTLITETGNQKGIVCFRPVFADTQRRDVRGLAFAVLRLSDALKATIPGKVIENELILAHGDKPLEIVVSMRPEKKTSGKLTLQRPILAFGKTLIVRTQAGSKFLTLHPVMAGLSTVLIGLLLTIATAIILVILLRRRQVLEGMVQERTKALRESNERFDELAEQSRTFTWQVDANGMYTYVSRTLTSVLGYEPEELVGKMHFYDLHPKSERERMKTAAMVVFARKDSFRNFENKAETKTGQLIWISTNGIPVLDEQGILIGYRGNDTDITQEKNTREDLARQTALLAGLLDSIPDLIFFKDREGVYLGCNKAFARFVGQDREKIIGQTDFDLFNATAARAFHEFDQKMIRKGQPQQNEEWVSYPDGKRVLMDTLKAPLKSQSGEPIGLLGISRDITKRKLAEQKLEKATARANQLAEEAQAANQAKSDFLANMSHEIRTPMNAVIGMTDLLIESGLQGEPREFAEIIQASGQALLHLVNDILDFSKMESDRMELVDEEFDLIACVEGAVDLIAVQAAEKEVELTYEIAPSVPSWIRGDADRIRQVLLNLLSNATKFTHEGEISLRIDATPENDQFRINFAVCDTGIGIEPDKIDQVFDVFTQADNTTTRQYGGSGLGLSISRKLCELMGGNITVESTPGEGSTFRFSIRALAISRCKTVRADPPFHPENRDVLIVDDNPTNLRILSAQLHRQGLNPIAFLRPAEALEAVKSGRPFSLLITDMQMPEMDGATLIREIRALKSEAELPVIILSSIGFEIPIAKSGIVAQLVKPVKPSLLFQVLSDILDQDEKPHKEAAAEGLDRISGLSVLLVEDNLLNQKVVARMLGKLGCSFDVASDGMEALDQLTRADYDVVLMDIQMPKMDGLTATKEILQKAENGKRPKIIGLTAQASTEEVERGLACGMDVYLTKPVQFKKLRAVLGEAQQLKEL